MQAMSNASLFGRRNTHGSPETSSHSLRKGMAEFVTFLGPRTIIWPMPLEQQLPVWRYLFH